MVDDQLNSQVQTVFREVLSQPALVIRNELTAHDVPGWDSISHLDLLVALENRFGIRFTTAEISRLRDVGDLLALIQQKMR